MSDQRRYHKVILRLIKGEQIVRWQNIQIELQSSDVGHIVTRRAQKYILWYQHDNKLSGDEMIIVTDTRFSPVW